MLGGMTMGMSLIVLNYESFIPHSLAIYGVWKIMDFIVIVVGPVTLNKHKLSLS